MQWLRILLKKREFFINFPGGGVKQKLETLNMFSLPKLKDQEGFSVHHLSEVRPNQWMNFNQT